MRLGLYRHQKGAVYEVTGERIDATNATSGRLLIDYKSMESGEKFSRDKGEFNQQVRWPDGQLRARFVFLAEVP